jgi:NAD(P)-dependent dehydrogenase (short-subunit alcohol dehydrogenase family)
MTDTPAKIAVVTGASRGLGRGIARALGSKGMTVYLTGRSLEGGLSDAAREVAEQGGDGIPVACNHANDAEVEDLFQQVRKVSGRLDLLVNNAAAVYPAELTSEGPFWEKPLKLADMIDVGLRSHYVASYYAAPLMIEAGRGLIANISFYGAVSYFHGPAYGAAKAGTDKMTRDMAVDLRPYGVSAVSIWPGFILTDELRLGGVPPQYADKLPMMERPEFTGLVIDALMRDSNLLDFSGDALIGAELGTKYQVTDLDGKQPVSHRHSMGAPVLAERDQPSN